MYKEWISITGNWGLPPVLTPSLSCSSAVLRSVKIVSLTGKKNGQSWTPKAKTLSSPRYPPWETDSPRTRAETKAPASFLTDLTAHSRVSSSGLCVCACRRVIMGRWVLKSNFRERWQVSFTVWPPKTYCGEQKSTTLSWAGFSGPSLTTTISCPGEHKSACALNPHRVWSSSLPSQTVSSGAAVKPPGGVSHPWSFLVLRRALPS